MKTSRLRLKERPLLGLKLLGHAFPGSLPQLLPFLDAPCAELRRAAVEALIRSRGGLRSLKSMPKGYYNIIQYDIFTKHLHNKQKILNTIIIYIIHSLTYLNGYCVSGHKELLLLKLKDTDRSGLENVRLLALKGLAQEALDEEELQAL